MKQITAFFAFLIFSLVVNAQEDAAEILRLARINQVQNEAALSARLRWEGQRIPFTIILKDRVIRYKFTDPEEAVILELRDDGPWLAEQKGDKSSEVKGARFDHRVRESSVTYEDLAMRFLYWPISKYLGSDVIRTRSAHKIEVHPGQKIKSLYGVVRLWVDKATGSLLRMEGYDWQGHLIKRFEVVGVQKIDGQWFLKTMRVETFEPETRKVIDRTYLDVLDQLKP
ncbi:MAG: outer membrane lipoprotein-sorting protein [Chthoniobacterales bacterium]